MRDIEQAVIRFSGDSGDGMQLTGTQFSDTSAQMGNDLATFPDFPAEIRAPQGTVAGVSGFQVHIGAVNIHTPGDEPDVLVAMNPAALKANIADLKIGGTIILNEDAFTDLGFKKAGYEKDPTPELTDYKIIKTKITSQTKLALENSELDTKSKARCKNFYALGITYFMYARKLEPTIEWIREKFKKNTDLVEANITALKAGFNFGDTIEVGAGAVEVPKANQEPGIYRQINGNTATAWGIIYGAERAGVNLFLGSYPITPASDILHELSKHKNLGVKTFQAEDEIAACCAAVGASYSGALGLTTSSGPGIALKSEALNLALMLELPLIVIDVQRGGPSTGLPTKTEQSDLNMAMFGRNGDSPLIVLAAKSPSDCFNMAYEAARLTIEHMTPVVLLTDGYIANGSTPWKLPDLEKDFEDITPRFITEKNNGDNFLPYKRDAEKLARSWALPGTPELMHRVGGLEKEVDTGNVSYDPVNHETMVNIREQKIAKVANFIPEQTIEGNIESELLVISWGGTYGSVLEAVNKVNATGKKCAHIHLQYLNPLPRNLEAIIAKYPKRLVCELNRGQLRAYLQGKFGVKFDSYSKVQGKPFKVRELEQLFLSEIK
jgi:2-oxoglutarate ferredoxin oxidoreductase subunit alpha